MATKKNPLTPTASYNRKAVVEAAAIDTYGSVEAVEDAAVAFGEAMAMVALDKATEQLRAFKANKAKAAKAKAEGEAAKTAAAPAKA